MKDVDIPVEGGPRDNKALIYYDLKAVRKKSLFTLMICYEDFKHSTFNAFYEECISILNLPRHSYITIELLNHLIKVNLFYFFLFKIIYF